MFRGGAVWGETLGLCKDAEDWFIIEEKIST